VKLRTDRLRTVVIVLTAILVALAVFERKWAIYSLLGLLALLILVVAARWLFEPEEAHRSE
jgi:hypothetical protein